ncbi:hypothetical protein ACM26S_03130 [Kluyvera sichuanensis]|uniref:hypothetical protein n=1 Tax=Kluyvera sichuanensis TaxID=2725494 RepID=UPI0039F687B7
MSSKTDFKLYALCYMMITYALMFVFVLVFIDFAIGDSTEDVWNGRMTLPDYFLSHALLFLSMAGAGAAGGFVLWFVSYRKS